VRDRPEGVTDPALARVLADGWGLAGWTLQYAPVGAGSYHWQAAGEAPGDRRFVTVDDLDDKGWLGRTRPAVLAGLRVAMDAAAALRRSGLGFVTAPEPGLAGETVRPLGARHAVTVFPFLPGTPGDWGEPLPAPERGELITMLAALHRADPAASRLPKVEPGLSWRGDLETALGELTRPWTGGPYAEPARALLAGAAGQVRRRLDDLDRRAGGVAAADVVITHGEPHPGNVIRLPGPSAALATSGIPGTCGVPRTPGDSRRAGATLALIDWDTAGLAPPERDLWLAAAGSADELLRYADLTGRHPDRALLEFYRLRWALDDVACFVRDLRAPHGPTPGAHDDWQNLQATVADLAS
jgi:spectinomycin phosphotransferase